jgi:hypothetical protein
LKLRSAQPRFRTTEAVNGEAMVWAPTLQDRHVKNCRLFCSREEMLLQLPRGSVCCEVGVQSGYFSDQIIRSVKPSRLHLIDTDLSQIHYDSFPLQPHIDSGIVKLHQGLSTQVLASFGQHVLDWIYIDADHRYEAVVRDIEQAIRVVKPEGLIVFNDYTKYSPLEMVQYGVMEAVNDLCLSLDYEMVGLALHGLGYHDVILRKMPGTP